MGSPVHLKDGRFVYTYTDLTSSGPGRDFAFSRFYNNLPVTVNPSSSSPYYGPLGAQWGHSFNWVLTEYGGSSDVRVIPPDLTALDFTHNTTYSGTGDARDYTLTKSVSSTWTLEHRFQHVTVNFDSSFHATTIEDKYGITRMDWGAPSASVTVTQVVTQVTAPSGLTYNVTYSSPDGGLSNADPTKRWYIGTVKENASAREIRYTYLSDQLVYEVTDTGTSASAHLTHGYASAGADPTKGWILISVVNRKGQTIWSQDYNTARRLVSQNENATGAYTYSYNDPTSTITKTSPHGETSTAIVDSDGHFTSYSDFAGGQFSYTYDGHGNMTNYTDAAGGTLTASFNGDDLPTSITQSGSLVTGLDYDANRFVSQKTDPGGHVTTVDRDAKGNVTSKTNALGQVETWTYNTNSEPLTYTNRRGYTTSYTYNTTDSAGQPVSITNPAGHVTLFEYDGQWRKTAQIAPNGGRTSYAYDSANRVTQVTDALGSVKTMTYDLSSNVSTTSTWRGFITTYQYYGTDGVYDVPTTIWTPMRMANKSYDNQARLIFDGASPSHEIGFDAVGRTVNVTENGTGSDSYTYTAASQVATHKDKLGGTTSFSYDSVARLVRTTLPDATTERIEYDDCSNITARVARGGGRTEYTYDAIHRLVSQSDPMSRVTTYGYDENDNQTRVTRPGNEVWQYSYDNIDRKTTETDPGGNVTTYGYSCACMNPTSITNARGKTWTFEYDLLGRKTAEVDPLGHRWEWTYDADGNVLTETAPTSAVVTYSYDSSGRKIGVVYPDLTSVTITYCTGEAEINTDQDAATKRTYSYDTGRRITSIQAQPWTGFGWDTGTTVYYSYDASGKKTRVATTSMSNAAGVNYTRDSMGRVTRLDDVFTTNMGFSTESTTVTYTSDGLLASIMRPGGVTTSVTYTAANEVGSVTHSTTATTIEAFSISRDSRGNITSKGTLAGTISYGYDTTNRVTSTTGPSETESFSYDAAGNIVGHNSTVTGNVTSSYNDADQLVGCSNNTTYTYDTRGNLTQTVNGTTTWTYAYTGANLLKTAALNGTVNVTYSYYPASASRRSRQAVGQNKQLFILDDFAVFQDLEDAGGFFTTKATYASLDGIDTLISRRELSFSVSSGVGFFLGDQLGSVHFVVDDGANVKNSYTYSTFGKLLSSSETVFNRYGFTQREGDTVTDLYYYRNRWYSPSSDRFTQRDPIGLEGGTNTYTYADNDPAGRADPLGLSSKGPVLRLVTPNIVSDKSGCEKYFKTSCGEIRIPQPGWKITCYWDVGGPHLLELTHEGCGPMPAAGKLCKMYPPVYPGDQGPPPITPVPPPPPFW